MAGAAAALFSTIAAFALPRTRKRKAKKSHDALQQVFQALQSREDEDALAIFQRIRQHEDAETIMERLHASDVLLGLREEPHSRSASVSCSAPRPYMPRPLLAPDDSIFTRLSTTPIQVMPSNYLNREVRFSSSFRFLPCMSSGIHSVKPHPSVKILDSRLDLITPSRWTGVSADDDMLRILLGRYFIQEYMRSACFQKDQFLHDMLSESMQFCSPLLVNWPFLVCVFAASQNRGKKIPLNETMLTNLFDLIVFMLAVIADQLPVQEKF
ncbi:hypothetical protein E4U33_006507 [Claviceps sp. LM78 group G4]|nr:hypothetical protein E4U33_006507 [Claviceps sp. LM78 group G4]